MSEYSPQQQGQDSAYYIQPVQNTRCPTFADATMSISEHCIRLEGKMTGSFPIPKTIPKPIIHCLIKDTTAISFFIIFLSTTFLPLFLFSTQSESITSNFPYHHNSRTMRSAIITGLLALGITRVAAQDLTDQSAPFYLAVTSSNATLNGSALYPCHEGAAIEGLCLGGPLGDGSSLDSYTYNLNFSSQAQPDPVLGTTGVLTWVLHGGNFNLSSSMSLSYNPTSNVALPLFTPSGTGTSVGFDDQNKMFIPQYYDDTQSVGVFKTAPIYRWSICKTYYGYSYTTLAWIMGPGSAGNPTCQEVDVVRVFA
jgi:hypothetical protein